tara:strand:+ start:1 stop:1869 length:1869 start_codon:yes stop_codon:yes gene_type:complete
MAKYSDIKGFTVQTVSSDPAASIAATGSFSSGGTLNTPRTELAGTVGIQTAAMATGRSGPAPAAINEQYDGSSWTEVGDLNTGRGRAAAAATSYTASIVFGGVNNPGDSTQSITESWNGSAWTEVNDLPAVTSDMAGLGTQTSAFCVGGNRTAHSNLVYSWDGTSWTSGTAINTGRQYLAASGTTPAGLVFGGRTYPGGAGVYANTESWNGSSWTEVNDLNTARMQLGGFGTSTSALAMGGGTPSATAKAEAWDGTNWTEVSDLASANSMQSAAAGADSTVGLAVAGTVTEEWTTTPSALFQKTIEGQLFFNSTTNTFKETITDIPGATWASGGDVNTARYGIAASGDASNGLIAGGNDNGSPGYKNETEVYNGTSWTEVNNLNQERGVFGASNSSPYTDSVAFGGYTGTADTGQTEVWDGSSWTEVNDLNTSRRYNGGFGAVSTNALCCGGKTPASYPSPANTAVESWNGSSWTEVAEFSTGRNESPVGAGTNTAGLLYGGQYPPGLNMRANTESWDGTSWTEVNDLNTARGYSGGGGKQTIALMYGGRHSPGALANTESWNGTSWSEVNDISTARAEAGGSSNTGTSSALFSSGSAGPPSLPSATEEWTASLSNKTITAS